ncbi:MAG: cytochrome P450 [Gammaproteobacteria bacterium]
MGNLAEIYYDPYDYAIDADPYPVWKRMRDEAPVYWNDRFRFYALTRFEDVLDASIDTDRYSSAHGSVLELLDLPEEHVPRLMLFTDPPYHTQLRKLVSRGFTPRAIERLEQRVRALACQYLDAQAGRREFDLVQDFGAKLPMMVIGSMLGIPDERQDYFRERFDQFLHRDEGETDFNLELQHRVNRELAEIAFERRTHPRDDLMSVIVNGDLEEEGGARRKLTDREVAEMLGLIASAGNETVARLVGWMGVLLDKHPDERRKLVEHPELIADSVEEFLRYEPPSPVQARLLREEVTLHGTTMPRGAKVLLLTGAAGRDEREYPDPERFDVTRKVVRHVTFGIGPHYCLGASLARLEGKVALEELLKRYPRWEVDYDNAEPVHTSTVRGYQRLPVRV